MKREKIILSLCAIACVLTMGLTWNSSVGRALIREQPIRGILVGSDYDDHARHSDTLMVISYDPKTRFLDVLSIPRDTMVTIPSMRSVRRINEVFTYEFRHSGRSFDIASKSLKNVVETVLSSGTVHPFVIPYYFTVDYKGFRSFIDAIGGVPVRITEPMHYDDNWGNLHIHFDPGVYVLNGKQALEYVRFRGKSADQGRVRRQQIFLREVLKRMKRPAILWRLPQYATSILSGFHTNLETWDMAMLLLEGRRVNRKNIRLMSLPVTPKGNLLKADPEATRQIVAMMESPLEGAAAISGKPSDASWRGKATIQVWNASDKPAAAKEVMSFLRRNGFDVVRIGNFNTRQFQTLIVDRSGDLRPAQAVAEAMKSEVVAEVVSRPMPSLDVDVDVVIGNDYRLKEKKWSW